MKLADRDKLLLAELPANITAGLLKTSDYSDNGEEIVKYFRESSNISEILMSDPASYKMLEIMYKEEMPEGVIDRYIVTSESAQALRDRLKAVISYLRLQIDTMITGHQELKILNLGCGSARDSIGALENNQNQNNLFMDCVDTDSDALATAKMVAGSAGVNNGVHFSLKSLMNLDYRKEADLGLLIGVLCSLPRRECVMVLKKTKRYFKPGGILIASNVTNNMLEKEPFFSRVILRDVIGWELVFKTTEELQSIFEEAGYEWTDVFYDEPYRFHAMGVGRIP